jgi:Zn-dependent metalloprotease
MRYGKLLILAFIALVMLIPGASVAQEQPDERSTAGGGELLSHLGDARIYRNGATGKVSLIGATTRQNAIDRPAGLPANAPPVAAARAHLSKYGALFGLHNQARELRSEGADDAGQGRSVVQFQQVHDGVPVLGGELNVQLTEASALLVANGEVLPGVPPDTNPDVSAAEARETAVAKIARDREPNAADLDVTEPELWIYDPTLLGDPGPPVPKLVWRMQVTPSGLDYFNELVLIDAKRGGVVLNFNQVHEAKNRLTYDWGNDAYSGGWLACDESDPCTDGYDDVQLAHRYAGETYDFYATNHGRDSINNAGMALISNANYCDEWFGCPIANAFWNGSQMFYGDGWAVDDVVGHEMTHGVTQYESNLIYRNQSGAINESFSDVWGEFVDFANTSGTDTATTRWQVGEDIEFYGPIRDMEDPTIFRNPDRMLSRYYSLSTFDNGGVHHNSGVNNKAAFLMTDGGTFNGKTVTGLGVTKVAKIYYEVQTNLLTSASDYGDLYGALQQACTNLTGTSDITATDCEEVKDAVDATEMNLTPVGNQIPRSNNDSYATDEDTTLTVNAPGVLGNDFDPDGDVLTARLSSNPRHGQLTFNDDGSFEYIPASNFNGTDSFSYQAHDGLASTRTATVILNVDAVNDAPTQPGAISSTESLDNDGTFQLYWNNSNDVEGDDLTYTLEHRDSAATSDWSEVASGLPTPDYTFGAGNPAELEGLWDYRVKAVDDHDPPASSDYREAPDLVRVDKTPPVVSSTTPLNNATGVDATANISASFFEEGSGIDPDTIITDTDTLTSDTFKVVQVKPTGKVTVSGTVNYDEFSQTATFHPSNSLAKGLYRATLTTGAKDNAGNALANDYTWTFTTAGPPSRR